MFISVIQFCPIRNNKEQNIQQMLKECVDDSSDLILFPELSTSGYYYSTKSDIMAVADSFESETIFRFQELSTRLRKVIIFGFPEIDGDLIYNSAAIMVPDSKQSRVYRKSHLFYKERNIFEPGNTGFFVTELPDLDLKLGTMICYDWRFPEASRSLALLGADLIVCPSNLVTNIWRNVMPARAIENKVYLAVANRTGSEDAEGEELMFNGDSAVWSYNGNIMASADGQVNTKIQIEIHPESTRDKSFNMYNDIFKDRRPELYKI